MEKYKICPSCGKKNKPTLFECLSCEADLTGVKITDDIAEETKKAQETAQPQSTQPEQPGPENTVRICDCGTKNPPNARKCSACGEDISDILPTQDACDEKEETVPFMLTSVDESYAFEIKNGVTVIGRESEMKDYLADKSFVSRKHCKITCDGNNVFVENESNTNYTYINNEKITEKTKLSDGDELELGGLSKDGYQDKAAYFIVRISKCM